MNNKCSEQEESENETHSKYIYRYNIQIQIDGYTQRWALNGNMSYT